MSSQPDIVAFLMAHIEAERGFRARELALREKHTENLAGLIRVLPSIAEMLRWQITPPAPPIPTQFFPPPPFPLPGQTGIDSAMERSNKISEESNELLRDYIDTFRGYLEGNGPKPYRPDQQSKIVPLDPGHSTESAGVDNNSVPVGQSDTAAP